MPQNTFTKPAAVQMLGKSRLQEASQKSYDNNMFGSNVLSQTQIVGGTTIHSRVPSNSITYRASGDSAYTTGQSRIDALLRNMGRQQAEAVKKKF